MPVKAYVHTVVVGHAVVVARRDVVDGVIVVVFAHGWVELLEGEGGGIARGEDPGEACVELFAELIGKNYADIVAAVIFCREGFAVVELLAGAVEESVGVAPSVAEPAGEFANCFLGKEFHTVSPAAAHADFIFPTLGVAPEGGTVFVLEQVVHVFVVSFDRKVEGVEEVVEKSGCHLVGVHRSDMGGDRNPEVGGEGDGRGAEEVEILGHVGVADFGRELVAEEVAAAETWLEGGVEFVLNGETGKVETEVDFEMVVDTPVVLEVDHGFVCADIALSDDGVDGGCFFTVVGFFDACCFGGEVVEDIARAEFNSVVGGRGIVEVGIGGEVADAGIETHGVIPIFVMGSVD